MSSDATGSHHMSASPQHTSPLTQWPPAWQPAAVVFDCDGLLVDTEAEWIDIQNAYLAEHGTALHPTVRREITGQSAEVVVQAIADAVEKDPYRVGADLVERVKMLRPDDLTILPGAVETVRAAAAKVPVAIASNSPRESLDVKLEALGLVDVVDLSLAIEDVEHPKPAPDLYRDGARRLGAEPSDSLAFEDSEVGAQAATAAGLQLIAVPSIPGQDPAAPRRLASLLDPVLAAWIDSWQRRR